MRPFLIAVALGGFVSLSSVVPAEQASSRHVTATIVSLDATGRTMVIEPASGPRRTVELAEQLRGFGDLRPGDHVLLTLEGQPGRDRVSQVVRSGDTTAPARGSVSVVSPEPRTASSAALAATDAKLGFDRDMTALAQKASQVDRLWASFRDTCKATVSQSTPNSREWFALWDGRASADLSNGFCRDLQNQIVDQGTAVVTGVRAAQETVAELLLPGDVRDIRARHALDWEGWNLPAPDRQKQP